MNYFSSLLFFVISFNSYLQNNELDCRLPYKYNKFIDDDNNQKTEVFLADDNKLYLIRDSIDLMVSKNNKLRFYFLNYDKNKSGCGEEKMIVMNNLCEEVFKSTISKENRFNLNGNVDSEIFQFNLRNGTKSILCLGSSWCGSAYNYSYYDIFYDNGEIIFNEIISSTTGWSVVNFLDKKNIYFKIEQEETFDDEGNIKNCHYDCPSKIKVSAFRLSDNLFLGDYTSINEHKDLIIEDEIAYEEWLVELIYGDSQKHKIEWTPCIKDQFLDGQLFVLDESSNKKKLFSGIIYRINFWEPYLLSEDSYLNGKKNGYSRVWHSNGRLNVERSYSNGYLEDEIFWDYFGKKCLPDEDFYFPDTSSSSCLESYIYENFKLHAVKKCESEEANEKGFDEGFIAKYSNCFEEKIDIRKELYPLGDYTRIKIYNVSLKGVFLLMQKLYPFMSNFSLSDSMKEIQGEQNDHQYKYRIQIKVNKNNVIQEIILEEEVDLHETKISIKKEGNNVIIEEYFWPAS